MYKLIAFLDRLGIGNGLEITEENLTELKEETMNLNLSNAEDRKLFISYFTDKFEAFFLKDWVSYYPVREIDSKLLDRIETCIYSVTIQYIHSTNKFEYEIDKNYLENITIPVNLSEEIEVLEYLSPGFEIRSMFLNNDKKPEIFEQTLIESVKRIIEKKNVINELNEIFPELIRNAVID